MKNMMRLCLLTGMMTLLWSCQSEPKTNWTVETLETPCQEGGEGHLVKLTDGTLALSWVEYVDDTTDQLRWTPWNGTEWGTPVTIAGGSDWFVNWADFPSMAPFAAPGKMAAHWLQKSAEGTYDYEVRVSTSVDGGQTWEPSFVPHQDSIPAEHGFVSMQPFGESQMLAVWLDGRFTKQDDGAMTLRTAAFTADGTLSAQKELDHRICDCCQTDLVVAEDEALVVYRDRSQEEIRDIWFVRYDGSGWSEPQPVHRDNWLIAGCPVNGPAVAKNSGGYWAAWFTGADNEPKVKVAHLAAGQEAFSEPQQLDFGNPLGRVDVVTLGESVFVSWMENGEEEQAYLCLAELHGGEVVRKEKIKQTSGSRAAGFPVLEVVDEQTLFLAHTEVDETSQRVIVERINLAGS